MNNKYSVVVIFLLFSINSLFATNYYVATTGSDSNTGTSIGSPYATITKPLNSAIAGDTIWIQGGVYKYTSTISISKSGNQQKRICVMAYNNERPILDFSGCASGKRGISLTGSYWHFKGIDIRYARDNAFFMSGTSCGYNIIEFCSFYENQDTGLQMGDGAHDNNIINCDSYFNADPTDYGDADGFAPKLTVGSNNYFYGCRAWQNVDDGWDGYLRGATNMSTILENCWTWNNGFAKDWTDYGSKANGNGFKMGGADNSNSEQLNHNFTLINCLAFCNKAKGFDQNNNTGSMYIYNGTGFGHNSNDNYSGDNFSIPKVLSTGHEAVIINGLSHGGSVNLNAIVKQTTNSWNSGLTVTDDDFESIDTSGVAAPRNADGSLPEIKFMHLKESSKLVDAGTDCGYAFKGKAPDLGCFEVGMPYGSTTNTALIDIDLSMKVFQTNDKSLYVTFRTSSKNMYSWAIYNIGGQIVKSSKNNQACHGGNNFSVDIHELRNGIYLFRLSTGGKTRTSKVLINNN